MFCFCTYFEIGIISFAKNLCFFPVFHFFEFSCWLSSTNNLIWIFVAFVAFTEVVSLWLVLMIVIGIPGLLTAKGFFSLLFEKGIRYLWYDPTQYLPLFFSYLLTTNFGRYCCLIGCWSILTYWWSSITSKTCWDNVYTGKR